MPETEMMIMEPRNLNMDDGWEEQVNRHAARMSQENEDNNRKYAKAYYRRKEQQQAKKMIVGILLGMLIVIVASICLAWMQFIPHWILFVAVLIGVAVYAFYFGRATGSYKKGY